MAKKQNNKIWWIVGGIIIVIIIISMGKNTGTAQNPIQNIINKIINPSGGGGSSSSPVVNKGVGMKAYIVDENGNIKEELLSNIINNNGAFSIISSQTPSGFLAVSDASCVSSLTACTTSAQCGNKESCFNSQCTCSFLALSSSFDNSAGDSDVVVNSVNANVLCSSGNTHSSCGSVPNAFGEASITNTKRGNMNSKFTLPLSILKGTSSSSVISDGMALEEVALGLMDFKVSITDAIFKDANGNDQPLTGKYGSLTLRINPNQCSDNTPADVNNADADSSSFCSVPNKGKYCRASSQGTTQLTDKASLCGCPTGQLASGEICKAVACEPNSCISGTVNYCLADGKSVETRCKQCQVVNCPLDAYGSTATSCNPDTSNVISQCVYPAVGGSGFLVSMASPVIPTISQCGDGVKNGAEQCDGSDFGGESCSTAGSFTGGTLSCSASCTYITSGCTAGYVKFRTLMYNIESSTNVDEIAFNTACSGVDLTSAGEYGTGGIYSTSSNSASAMAPGGPIGATKVMDLTIGGSIKRQTITGTINKALFQKNNDPTVYYVCADDADGVGYACNAFKTGISTFTIYKLPNSIDSTKETSCSN